MALIPLPFRAGVLLLLPPEEPARNPKAENALLVIASIAIQAEFVGNIVPRTYLQVGSYSMVFLYHGTIPLRVGTVADIVQRQAKPDKRVEPRDMDKPAQVIKSSYPATEYPHIVRPVPYKRTIIACILLFEIIQKSIVAQQQPYADMLICPILQPAVKRCRARCIAFIKTSRQTVIVPVAVNKPYRYGGNSGIPLIRVAPGKTMCSSRIPLPYSQERSERQQAGKNISHMQQATKVKEDGKIMAQSYKRIISDNIMYLLLSADDQRFFLFFTSI